MRTIRYTYSMAVPHYDNSGNPIQGLLGIAQTGNRIELSTESIIDDADEAEAEGRNVQLMFDRFIDGMGIAAEEGE